MDCPEPRLTILKGGTRPCGVKRNGAVAATFSQRKVSRFLCDRAILPEGGTAAPNHGNGYTKKTVITDTSQVELEIPRDRRGTFEPQLIAKYQRRFPGFDDKIISMYARGMSVRDIQGHLRELYGIEASPQLISTVTDAVLEEVSRWQARPLDALYAIVFSMPYG
jgi:transposase-like protein